jgi:glutamate/aspartate transport system permease protein
LLRPAAVTKREAKERHMFGNFDFAVIQNSIPLLWTGLWFTIKVTIFSAIGGVIFGTVLALARLSSKKWLSTLAGAYVNGLRSIPLLLVIFWFYFLVPYIGAWIIGAKEPIKVGALESCLITFIMFEACYFCEIMRAGIQSIARGQPWAGYALGMTYGQTMRLIVLPQAFRNMLPVLLTQTIILFQDVSLVGVLSIKDFVGTAKIVNEQQGRPLEMYLTVAVVYFVICFGLSTLVKQLQKKIAIIR